MRRTILGLIALSLLSSSSSLLAEETDGEKAFKSYAEHIVGGVWKTTTNDTEIIDGKIVVKDEMMDLVDEYRPIAGGKFVWLFGSRDGITRQVFSVLGVDPETNKFTWWGFNGWGVGKTTTDQIKEGAWVSEMTGVYQGQPFSVKTRLVANGNNQTLAEQIELIVSGENREIVTPASTWTRHEGTITKEPSVGDVEDSEEAAETDAEKAFASYANFMVGGVWKHSTDAGQQQTRRYRWLAKERFLYTTIKSDSGQLDALTIYGINPSTEKFGAWHYGKSGLHTITVTPQGDNIWIAEGNLTNEEGKKIGWKGKETRTGRNEVHVERLEATEDGKKVELPEWSQTWKRHKD